MSDALAVSTTTVAIGLVAASIALTVALSTAQAFIGARVGSDHPVHVFLTKIIRANGYHLFVRVPRLLNTCYCAALPLYIHWIVSHFRAAAVYWCERLLNPAINTLHVIAFAVLALIAARLEGLPGLFVGLATCAFALTPQFFHATSARNFGLSARGAGLLFLTLFFLAAYAVEAHVAPAFAWPALVVFGWLIWGFSTFAQQALCIISVILVVTSRRYVPLAGASLGLMLFIAVHPTYSLGYLKYTLRFIRTYRKELAPISILVRRNSIWRDLVWDIWRKARGGFNSGARYIYENSLLVVIVLNPLVVLACWAVLCGALPARGFIAYAGAVALAGAIAVLVTSFRATRFLGEPERYAEAVTPWAVLCGAYVMYVRDEWWLLGAVAGLFLFVDLLQLFASTLLLKHVGTNAAHLDDIETVVRQRLPSEIRFCSNNEHFTKMLMQNDWRYAYCLAVGEDYCGMKLQEAFASFPLLRRKACERITAAYRVNACLLDRSVFETLFDEWPSTLHSMTVAYESTRFRLLILEWNET